MKNLFLSVFALSAAAALSAKADGEMVATADPIPVDMRTGVVLGVVGTANLRYSPYWSAENASIRIETVAGAVTNLVKAGSLDEEGVFTWTQPDADVPAYKLLLWTIQDGVAVGEPLTALVSFASRSLETAVAAVDTRADSLRLVAEAGGKVNLAYSTAWAEDASSVAISAIKLSGRGGEETATNAIFAAVADAEGAVSMSGVEPGYWKLRYLATDADGAALLEYVTGEFKRKCGLVFAVR